MARRKAIKNALQGFLGTYISRYSDYDGYLLFGFLVADSQRLTIDLLTDQHLSPPDTPQAVAVVLAQTKFREQVAKVGVPFEYICEATLDLVKQPSLRRGFDGKRERAGYDVSIKARAKMDTGKIYERGIFAFIAPHDASIEFRSARAMRPKERTTMQE